MNKEPSDPIVAEVRKNREALLAEFGGDVEKLSAYLKSKRSERKAAGVRYVTEEERLLRLARRKERDEKLVRELEAIAQ